MGNQVDAFLSPLHGHLSQSCELGSKGVKDPSWVQGVWEGMLPWRDTKKVTNDAAEFRRAVSLFQILFQNLTLKSLS